MPPRFFVQKLALNEKIGAEKVEEDNAEREKQKQYGSALKARAEKRREDNAEREQARNCSSF